MRWRETTLEDLLEYMLEEDLEGQKKVRGEWIKNKFSQQWRGLPGYETIDQFIEKLGEIDPSQKGIYMPWIARLAITKPTENRTEDLERLNTDLQTFETNKARIQNKDINAYKSFQELYDVIAPFLQPKKKSKEELEKEKEEERLAKVKGAITTVYQGPEGWIRIPNTVEAAIFLGQNTRWCTAARNSNYFNHYNNTDKLFVVYDKETKTRSQLHIQSGQFAGEDDRDKGLKAVPQWAREPIVQWYEQNTPQLSLQQIMGLTSFTDRNLAKGTDHEDLVNLMQKFGV